MPEGESKKRENEIRKSISSTRSPTSVTEEATDTIQTATADDNNDDNKVDSFFDERVAAR